MVSMEELLNIMVQRGGSDLHISVGAPPKIRVDGRLYDTEHDLLQPEVTKKLIYSVLTPDQVAKFEKIKDLDFSFGVANLGRFRTNAFIQRGTIAAVLRVIPFEVHSFEASAEHKTFFSERSRLARTSSPRKTRMDSPATAMLHRGSDSVPISPSTSPEAESRR